MTKRWAVLYIPNGTYIVRNSVWYFLTKEHALVMYNGDVRSTTDIFVATIFSEKKPGLSDFNTYNSDLFSNLKADCASLVRAELEVVEYPYD